jgi:threonylcarbamoyladenosine tRNA methylthiotransferase CDKAL1
MKKVLIKTYGCSFNIADSENMAGLLESSGRYELVDDEKDADLVIINSCTVKNNAETKFWRDVKNIKKPKILAGCVPQAEADKTKFNDFSVIGTTQITNIVHVADETLEGNIVQLLKKEHNPRLNIPKVRKNSIIEIIPINEGCLGNCSFCKTKFARGQLYSYDPDEIARQARDAINGGAKEIWLTSQDTACYGYDIKTNIVSLLKKILEMKRDFRIRLGMGNPDYFPDFLDELIEVFNDKRMFKFLHIPLQSGSDAVLKDMKRGYTSKAYVELITKIRKAHPDMTFSTDVIVGYPTETDEDFKTTLQVVEKTNPDVMNISRYWARPGTIAAKKKLLQSDVLIERSKDLKKLHDKIALENKKEWLGWEGDILIDEQGKKGTGTCNGRNYAYKPVIVKGDFKLGDIISVKVKSITRHDLRAEEIKK